MTDNNDQKEFIEKAQAEAKRALEPVNAKKGEIEAAGKKEVRELKQLIPDKERALEQSLDKLESASPQEQDRLKKEAEVHLGKVKQFSDSMMKELQRDKEINKAL